MKIMLYYPKLTRIAGSINAALVMAQLEFWFKTKEGKPFYKFLEPCAHAAYHEGDSWREEMEMGVTEFRAAYKKIAVMYPSKKAFLESEDRFQGKFYASYYDRIRKMTFYHRNHEAVEQVFEAIGHSDLKPGNEKEVQNTTKAKSEGQSSGKQDEQAEEVAGNVLEAKQNLASRHENLQPGLYRENKQKVHQVVRQLEMQNDKIDDPTLEHDHYKLYLNRTMEWCQVFSEEEKQSFSEYII